jgi:conjugative transfer region lipoprotein (TIGR03751 family)
MRGKIMPANWIKVLSLVTHTVVITSSLALTSGCASSVKKVVKEDQPTMEAIYNAYAGADEQAAYDMRKRELQQRDALSHPGSAQLGFPPQVNQLKHLYPRLPNPELFMYVRPHAVGQTGAPIPAYITRFTMYDREQYALPGETVETIRRNAVVSEALSAEDREAAIAAEEAAQRKKDRARLDANRQRGIRP